MFKKNTAFNQGGRSHFCSKNVFCTIPKHCSRIEFLKWLGALYRTIFTDFLEDWTSQVTKNEAQALSDWSDRYFEWLKRKLWVRPHRWPKMINTAETCTESYKQMIIQKISNKRTARITRKLLIWRTFIAWRYFYFILKKMGPLGASYDNNLFLWFLAKFAWNLKCSSWREMENFANFYV